MSSLTIQHDYLNYLKQKQIKVKIFLKNGIDLEGKIKEFNDYMLALDTNQETKMVYKQVITNISPVKRVSPDKFLQFD